MAIKVSGVTVIDDNRNLVNSAVKSKLQALGSISGVHDIDLTDGDTVTATITNNTTFTVSGTVSGATNTVYLYLTNPGAGTITWPVNTTWDKGNTPTLYNPGRTLIILESYDNGANWIGAQAWRENA